MKKKVIIVHVFLFSIMMGFYACRKSTEEKNYVKTNGPDVVPFRALQIDPGDVKLR